MSTIVRIEVSHHRLPLDPPFPAAWDPQPRKWFPATVVRVHDDAGRVGIGSGDAMYGFADHAHHFLGEDPLELDRHAAVLANVDFHAGRPWPLDVALWDLAGQIEQRPVWSLLGGHDRRIRAYASSGVHRPVAEMVAVARRALDRGFPALKVRFGRESVDADLAIVRAIRDELGDAVALMVDCNQGWRMPWDTRPPWHLERAVAVGAALADERITWMEEPLHRGDHAGMAALRGLVDVPIAGAELTREDYELRLLLEGGCLDVFQPDCVCTQGISGLRRFAVDVVAAGATFTPHTWGNGIGLLANAHLTAGTVGAPFLEFPFDPPEWTTQRRDFLLTDTIEVDDGGWLELSDRPGLGCTLDEDVLVRTATTSQTYTYT